MVYPGRKIHAVLPDFAGTNTVKQPREARARLVAFVVGRYEAGYSLRELAELTGRSQTAIRRILDEQKVPRRPAGAPVLTRSGRAQ